MGVRLAKIRTWALIGCASAALVCGTAFADGAKLKFAVPAQDLPSALTQFADQSDREILFSPEAAARKRAAAVTGELSPEEALTRLLTGTGLTFRVTSAKTLLIEVSQNAPSAPPPPSTQPTDANERSDDEDESSAGTDRKVEKVTVTGTRIKGARPSSPVITITRDEMRKAGYNNLGQAARALPQNFSGGQNPEVQLGTPLGASVSNNNVTGSSSVNLRGLGADATLTLLNGNRLPYDGTFQATDVSVIPVAAIERMEVLLDGASAIYGSDAVGGVVNIVLRRDYDGAEFSVRFGHATDGGYQQEQLTALAGTNWGSGGFLISSDHSQNEPVKTRDRDYLGYIINGDVDIIPQHKQQGVLFSGHQDIGTIATFNLDAFNTERSQEQRTQSVATLSVVTEADVSIWGAAPSLDFWLPGDWSIRLHGAFGDNDVDRVSSGFSFPAGTPGAKSVVSYFNGMQSAGVQAEGPLFELPGGPMRLSAGGGYRQNTFDRRQVNLISGVVSSVIAAEDSSQNVYGELYAPLVSEEQGIPLIERLSLNGAVRYDEYDTFGSSTTPKIGAIWGLAQGLDLKASWGKSFKVPTLVQQNEIVSIQLRTPAQLGGVGAPAGSQVLNLVGGNNEGLGPEKAEIVTTGFVAQPEFLPRFRLEAGWFDIDYTDRVALPIDLPTQSLSNPAYAEFVTANPSVALQNAAFAAAGLPIGTFSPGGNQAGAPYDATKVIALVDNRYTNVSSQRVKGIDLTVRYSLDLFGGDLALSGNANWITDATRKLTSLAPTLPASGVNFWPADFKGRFGAAWSQEGLTLSANVYHTAAIIDRNVTPNVKRESMTTLDFVIDYQTDADFFLGEFGFTLAAANVFDESPPFMQPVLNPTLWVNYDSTNYSASGRVINMTITKRF